jgi:hypothetical protein
MKDEFVLAAAMTNMAMRSVLKNDPLNRTLEVTHNPLEKGTGTPNDNKPLGATMNIVPKIPVTKKATIHLKHGIVKYSVKVVINEMNKMLRPYPQCSFLGYHRIIDSSLQIGNKVITLGASVKASCSFQFLSVTDMII